MSRKFGHQTQNFLKSEKVSQFLTDASPDHLEISAHFGGILLSEGWTGMAEWWSP